MPRPSTRKTRRMTGGTTTFFVVIHVNEDGPRVWKTLYTTEEAARAAIEKDMRRVESEIGNEDPEELEKKDTKLDKYGKKLVGYVEKGYFWYTQEVTTSA